MEVLQTLYKTLCCLPLSASVTRQPGFSQSSIRINAKTYKTLRLLGEGGFSYVYLCSDSNGNLFAMKKIRCSFGEESYKLARREIAAYEMFDHANIIKCIDFTTLQERGSKIVYILLPFYKRGNLQDMIAENLRESTQMAEDVVIRIAKGICVALIQLHEYHTTARNSMEGIPADEAREPFLHSSVEPASHAVLEPYAHFDIKPGNIMLSDEGVPVLMDFGSCKPARQSIITRSDALRVQDEAAEHSTMPYRAPELFDTPTNSFLDEKVDIWSLGCTIYAMLYGHSPFETLQTEQGSIALAVLNRQFTFPDADTYSAALRNIIDSCLQSGPLDRPSARKVHEMLLELET